MNAPTSFSTEKAEAAATQASAAVADAVRNAQAVDTLQAVISLALIALVVWLWLRKDE